MQIDVRKGEKEDIEEIFKLVVELAEYEKAQEQVLTNPLDFENAGFSDNPSFHALIAEDTESKKIVGTAIYNRAFSTWKGNMIYLEDLIVTSDYRGLGVGKLLFSELVKIAADMDIALIKWQVLDWNEPAMKFYNSFQASYDSEWVNGKINKNQFKDILDKSANESL